MPEYIYQCKECGKQYSKVLPMSEATWDDTCECGGSAIRSLNAEHSSGVVDSQHREYDFEGDNGTRLYAASYLPHQKEEMLKNHPGRDFKLRNGCFIPVIKDRQDKKAFLKERGDWIEY